MECDENGHKRYEKDCEIIRMNNISTIVGLPVKWIRYNPDNKSFTKKHKEAGLLNTVQRFLNHEFLDNLDVEYLFY